MFQSCSKEGVAYKREIDCIQLVCEWIALLDERSWESSNEQRSRIHGSFLPMEPYDMGVSPPSIRIITFFWSVSNVLVTVFLTRFTMVTIDHKRIQSWPFNRKDNKCVLFWKNRWISWHSFEWILRLFIFLFLKHKNVLFLSKLSVKHKCTLSEQAIRTCRSTKSFTWPRTLVA